MLTGGHGRTHPQKHPSGAWMRMTAYLGEDVVLERDASGHVDTQLHPW